MVENGPSSGSRGRSLERFEESLKRLDPPAWMKQRHQSGGDNSDYSLRSNDTTTITTPNELTRTRPRYSDYRRSCSAQRSSTSNAYWRTDAARTPSSRGPSPGPGSRPATAGGRFQSSSFSRWSASTLCSDGQFSTGNNTPTDSVASAFSMRSSLHGVVTEPIYHPGPIVNSSHYRPLPHMQRPYLGWRSQDSLINDADDPNGRGRRLLTPAERLAYSYRHGSCSSARPNRQQQSLSKKSCYASEQLVHESIKSVSTAIMEFCQAEDVPQLPHASLQSPARTSTRTERRSRKENRAQIVWLESSFVSATTTAKSKL